MSTMQKTILLADDSETFLTYMRLLLRKMGFDVVTAESGPEALGLLKTVRPELIMLDINMRRQEEGIETLGLIKADENLSGIPVVMVTSESGYEVAEKCKRLGCAGYLMKPFDIKKLHEILQEFVYSPLGYHRDNLRINCSVKAAVEHKGTSFDLYTETISEGGVFIIKKEPFPVGSQVKVTMYLDSKPLCVKGSVIYVKDLFGDSILFPKGMAIKFKDIKDEDKKLLAGFIARWVAEDVSRAQAGRAAR